MNSNANLFRRYNAVNDLMMRAAMPRTDALDPKPAFAPRPAARRTFTVTHSLVTKTGFTLAEVARG